MRALAGELGVSRATLYRWTGQREQLLGAVIWSAAEAIHQQSMRDARGRGAKRILAVFDRSMTAFAKAPELRRFLENDPHVALRVLTRRDGAVQSGLVRAVGDLIRAEVARGAYAAPVDPAVLAYAIVRVGEAFLYNDAIVALEPNLAEAKAIVRLLLSRSAS
ncbi:MAG TPA: QsdR family transcriptional regulator [Candidatus Binatia bacterium]|nr:QsdR family transcriptional regulator [Candidatus Binatia bacterium]